MANIVAIVGRPNVGKSTFFNRLAGKKSAIMDDESGVTRDRHYGYSDWGGKFFTVIDTGGYVTGSDDIFEEAIRDQVNLAMEEATVILFLVDVDQGVHPLDQEFANVLRRTKKPVYVVANKADTSQRAHGAGEFYSLGFEHIFAVSSQNGAGTGDLLDEIISHFEIEGIENPDEGIPRISILGRPNVGKSSFTNLLLGTERSIVTEIAGTTRDAINSRYNAYGKEFIITDTAGLRRKSRVHENIEFYSVMRSIRALEDSDVCIVMIDAQNGLESQDMNIIGLANKNRKGIVILVNKWDLVEKDSNTAKRFEDTLKETLRDLTFIPIVFVSVHSKQRVMKAIETAIEVYENRKSRIPTSKLNDVMLPLIERNPPPALKGKYIKIKYITQLPTNTPTFAFFCSHSNYVKEPYERFLENRLRENFQLDGVPINIIFREK